LAVPFGIGVGAVADVVVSADVVDVVVSADVVVGGEEAVEVGDGSEVACASRSEEAEQPAVRSAPARATARTAFVTAGA
jgi:hypothetical protein